MGRVHDDDHFDRCLQRALQAADFGRADRAIVLAAATQLGVGDLTGWTAWWRRAGAEAFGQADALLDDDRLLEACQRYLQASEYFGLAVRGAGPDLSDPGGAREDVFNHVMAFRIAMPLLPEGCETLEPRSSAWPFGYLFWDRDAGPRSLVVATMAAGLTAESGYTHAALAVLSYGADCVIIDPVMGPESDERGGQSDAPVDGIDATLGWLRRQPGLTGSGPGLTRLSDYLASASSVGSCEAQECHSCLVVAALQDQLASTAVLSCLSCSVRDRAPAVEGAFWLARG